MSAVVAALGPSPDAGLVKAEVPLSLPPHERLKITLPNGTCIRAEGMIDLTTLHTAISAAKG